jgi:hypothetical protein
MDPTYAFRKALLRRLLDIVGVAALATPAIAAGCGAKVVVDTEGATTGTGGAGGATSTGTITGMGGNPTGGTCMLTSTGAGAGLKQVTECFAPLPDGCPDQYHANLHIVPTPACVYLASVDCGPIQGVAECCYLVKEGPQPPPCGGGGRPYLVDGDARTAWPEARQGGWAEGDLAPVLTGLEPLARAALAAAWTGDALVEHASIASFARFSMQLLAVGAPADLVAASHRAALDEVRHARLCFGLAGAYRGVAVAPSAFPFGGAVVVESELAAVAAATAREGAIGETLSAMLAAEQLAHATDPAVRRVLALIAEDEARHAELAWRVLTWALEQGDDATRHAVAEVFGNAARHLPSSPEPMEWIAPEVAAAHGRLDPEAARKAVVRALAEVILPCASALLARTASIAPPSELEPHTQRSPC